MKNVLLLAISVLTLSAFAPSAEAGGLLSRLFGRNDHRDRCDRNVRYDHRDWHGHSVRHSRHSDHPRNRWNDRSSAPVYCRSERYYEPYRSSRWDRDYRRPVYVREACAPRGGFYTAPRFAVSFGF